MRARPRVVELDLGARAPAVGVRGALLEQLEGAVVAGGDERREDRRDRSGRRCPRARAARSQRLEQPPADLHPVAGGRVQTRQVAGRVEAGQLLLAGVDLGLRRGERAAGAALVAGPAW